MSAYKKCSNGHYYAGDVCPYCKTEHFDRTSKNIGHTIVEPSCLETEAVYIPRCPHCGKPLRKYIPMPPKDIRLSSIHNRGDGMVPWNYGWDGKCENCGRDFNIVMRIDMGSTGPDNRIRETKISVGSQDFLHHLTCNWGEWRYTVLSGVVIETHCGLGNHKDSIFLSASELKYLMDVLQNSPILKQSDYFADYNESSDSDL